MGTDFAALFGRDPAVVASAPGRVNLIGEHTDYSGGYVLPVPIPQRTSVALAPRDDRRVRVASADVEPASAVFEYELGRERRRGDWTDYVQGITRAAAADGLLARGFDACVSSRLPIGAGLASSAALEVAVLRALREAGLAAIDDVRLALLGQRAENDFVGARVGIMDQLAASLGGDADQALFIDTRSLAYERVPLPPSADLVVIHSGLSHGHAAGEYNRRRAECEEAARLLGVPQLRDVTDIGTLARLPEPLRRRARHVVSENARVVAAVEALRRGDLRALGVLLAASHRSLRYDYEVSAPEVDLLVALAAARPDVYGARITGGGFGGAIIALARAGSGGAVGRTVAAEYVARTGRTARVLLPEKEAARPGEALPPGRSSGPNGRD